MYSYTNNTNSFVPLQVLTQGCGSTATNFMYIHESHNSLLATEHCPVLPTSASFETQVYLCGMLLPPGIILLLVPCPFTCGATVQPTLCIVGNFPVSCVALGARNVIRSRHAVHKKLRALFKTSDWRRCWFPNLHLLCQEETQRGELLPNHTVLHLKRVYS
jgi:hypothetical protein